MGTLLNRRRYMGGGGGYPADAIMTIETNPEVLAICYAQGWCANDKYMTASEAAAVTSIGTVFYNNNNIKHFEEFEYFTGVTSLANNAFRNCTNLTTLTIPENVTSLGNDTLRNNGIKSLYIKAKTLSSWGNTYTFTDNVIEYIYADCQNFNPLVGSNSSFSKLETVVCGSNVRSIALYKSSNLTSVSLNEGLTTLSANAFRNCTSLTTLTIPTTVTSFGNDAFRDSGIKNLYVNATNITSWGNNYTFYSSSIEYLYSNSELTSVVAGTMTKLSTLELGSNARSIGGFQGSLLTNVVVPEGVTDIINSCFRFCSLLESVDFPSTTSVINGNIFEGDANLTSVTIRATTPPTGVDVYTFRNSPNAVVYVPSGSVSAYQSAGGWSNWASRIQAIPT